MIVSFGELLFRFSPELGGGWIKQNAMPVFIGGAELNVATALANWGVPVRYSTVLPQNALADEVIEYMTQKGIDPAGVYRFGNRVGSYYLPQGTDLKNAGVIYDRAYSSFSELAPEKVDWQQALNGVSWLHLSAISPALNQAVADACLELVKAASEQGIFVSIDLNYRAKLWQYGVKPVEIMPGLVEYCDLVMGNIWAANTLLGIPLNDALIAANEQDSYVAHAAETVAVIQNRFPRCKYVANTFRFDYANAGIRYFATLSTGGQTFVSPEFLTESVVDKVGSGDCFMGGLIYGLFNQRSPQEVVDFAAAAAFGKLQEYGDATAQTEADVTDRLLALTK